MRSGRLIFDRLKEDFNQKARENAQEDLVRQEFPKIPKNDVVTPLNIIDLRKHKNKLDRKLGVEGKLEVEAHHYSEDARVSLYYEVGNLSCCVSPIYTDGKGAITRHRDASTVINGKFNISASIHHPYFDGDDVYAIASDDLTHWKIMVWREATNRVTVLGRTRNFHSLKSLEKVLRNYEDKANLKGHIDRT